MSVEAEFTDKPYQPHTTVRRVQLTQSPRLGLVLGVSMVLNIVIAGFLGLAKLVLGI